MALPQYRPGSASAAVTDAQSRGLGEPRAHGTKLGQAVTPQALQRILVDIFNAPNYRPPVLPRVALQLTSLTRQPNVSYDGVVAVLQKDPMIAASVLKVAQSAVYGGRRPVQSLKEALQRLGVARLRDIVWQVVTGMRLFRAGSLTTFMESLQAHNLFVAHAARAIAARAGVVAEETFLCGLLHDVGISATVSALVDTGEPLPPLDLLLDAIDNVHEYAGGLVATHWQLSPEITAVIKQHHRFNPHVKGMPVLTAVISVAERLAVDVGRGIINNTTGSVAQRAFDVQASATFDLALKRLDLNAKYDALVNEGNELKTKLVERG